MHIDRTLTKGGRCLNALTGDIPPLGCGENGRAYLVGGSANVCSLCVSLSASARVSLCATKQTSIIRVRPANISVRPNALWTFVESMRA